MCRYPFILPIPFHFIGISCKYHTSPPNSIEHGFFPMLQSHSFLTFYYVISPSESSLETFSRLVFLPYSFDDSAVWLYNYQAHLSLCADITFILLGQLYIFSSPSFVLIRYLSCPLWIQKCFVNILCSKRLIMSSFCFVIVHVSEPYTMSFKSTTLLLQKK